MADQDELLRIAASSGSELIVELEQARAETGDWSDQRQTDALVEQALRRCLDKLSATGCWGEPNRIASGELWKAAGHVLRAGELQYHARHKPRGYAGDFDMLCKICERWTCSHPLGSSFDRFFQEQAAPQSVRNRARIVAAHMASSVRRALDGGASAAHVVSVGAGPAIDMQLGLEQLQAGELQRLRLTLLDMDPDALQHASARLGGYLAADRLTLRRENLFRLPKLARVQEALNKADFISCAGLFDYLDGENATEMLSCFWRHLRPGGQAIVFNFAPSNKSRAYMEWIGNWYLNYRNEREIADLSRTAFGDGAQPMISGEESLASLFVACTKR